MALVRLPRPPTRVVSGTEPSRTWKLSSRPEKPPLRHQHAPFNTRRNVTAILAAMNSNWLPAVVYHAARRGEARRGDHLRHHREVAQGRGGGLEERDAVSLQLCTRRVDSDAVPGEVEQCGVDVELQQNRTSISFFLTKIASGVLAVLGECGGPAQHRGCGSSRRSGANELR